jgi:predicted esterase
MTTRTQKMANDLVKQSEELKEELIELERNFNIKKEQFIKIQGALEALHFVQQQEDLPESEEL